MAEILVISGILLAVLLFVSRTCACFRGLSRAPPPGPKGRLFSGNAHQIPRTESWRTYAKWAEEFGPVVHFRAYSRHFVVLNTAEAVFDLLERRHALYSDRPTSYMLFRLCGRENSVFNISSLHPRHRTYRRVLYTGLNARAIEKYWPLMQSETRLLAQGLLESPEMYEAHVRKNAAAVIMMVTYGYTVKSLDDEFIAYAKETSQITGWAMAPGRWLIDSFPILRFMPSWFPGAAFKRQAEIWRHRFDYLNNIPHMWVKTQIADGKAVTSFTSELLNRDDGSYPNAEEEDIIRWCASGLYAGAADTTVSALISFIMLMALYPDVQRQAQEELDNKIGKDNLPGFGQLDDLTYIAALLKEVLRFAPVGPLALPHKVVQDDEYTGFHIRKDTTVIANIWAIMHDARSYPSPYTFDPNRFLTSASDQVEKSVHGQPDPRKYAFGFGARTCPGNQFAEKSLLLSMCGILSSCTIRTANGAAISEIEFTNGITSHIKAFDIAVEPR